MSFLNHFKPLAIGIAFAKRYPRQTVVVITTIVIASLLESLSVMSVLPLITMLLQSGDTVQQMPEFIRPIFEMLGMAGNLGGVLCLMAFGFGLKAMLMIAVMHYVLSFLAKLQDDYRRQIIDNFLKARWRYYTDLSLGSVTNSLSGEISTLGTTYRQFVELVSAAIQGVFYVLISIFLSLPATLFALIFGIVMTAILRGFVYKTRISGTAYSEALRMFSGRLTDILSSIKSIRAMAKEQFMKPLLMKPSGVMQEHLKLYSLNIEILIQLQEWLMIVGMSVMMFVFIRLLNFNVSEFMFLAIIFQRIASRLGTMQRNYQQIARNENVIENIQDLIQTSENEVEKFSGTKRVDFEKDIFFKNINFSYADRPILNDVTLSVNKGDRIALIGASGSGKSTLIDLLIGLHEPKSGDIQVDGISLHDIDIDYWRHLIGYVPQETMLLHDTIANNVSLRDPSITEDMIVDALKRAEMWDAVQLWPETLDTMVGERGIKLSGGQRQRIALARALVKRPKLLILDEATAALDPETEKKICETIVHLGRDVTVIAISHQKALASIADNVYVIDKGTLSRATV